MSASREHRQRLYEQLVGNNIAGRFEITNLLGFGGMGAVYQALQRNMQRDVALKVIPSHDPTTTARFKREAITISKLQHPNTVTVFDYGETQRGLLFLAMEMLSGHTLSNLIETQGPLPPDRVVHVACQVSRSLHEAHQIGIVHRDIKPDNIFLIEVDNDPDFVKVLDFGIAKIVRGEDNVELTGTGRIIGTPKYMSPEQILAEPVDHRSDIYSLACIVFEMLCGSPPFQDTSTTKLMLAHAHQAPPTFAERLPNQALACIPGPLEQVVRKALSKSPMERQVDIDEFRAELEAALEATDESLRVNQIVGASQVQSTPSQPTEITDSSDLLSQHSSQTLSKLSRPAPAPAAEVTGPSSKEPPVESKSKLPHAIVGMLILVGGLAAYMLLGPGDEPGEPAPSSGVAAQPDEGPTEEMNFEAAAPDPPSERGIAKEAGSVELNVVTKPEGAQIYEEGRHVGRTPMKLETTVGNRLTYSFELEGYDDKTASFTVDEDDADPEFVVELDKKRKARTNRRRRHKRKTRPENTSPRDTTDKESTEEVDKPVRPKIEKMDDDEDDSKATVDRL